MSNTRLPSSLPVGAACLLLVLASACTDDPTPFDPGDLAVPFPVTDLAIAAAGDSLILTWTATGDDGPNGTADRYDLRHHDAHIDATTWPDATEVPIDGRPRPAGQAERVALDLLPAGPVDYFALRVIDEAGNTSALSNVVFLDRTGPAAVTDLQVRFVEHERVMVAWTAPADDGPTGGVAAYELRAAPGTLDEADWDDAPVATIVPATAAAGGEEITILAGLDPDTVYRIAVRARDGSGNASPLSNRPAFTTRPVPPGWWDGFDDAGVVGSVYALLATADGLVAGGDFGSAGGVAASVAATWDGTRWQALAGGLTGAILFTTAVYGLAALDDTVYAIGSFTGADGMPAAGLAAWADAAWSVPALLPDGLLPRCVAAWHGDLYVGAAYLRPAYADTPPLMRLDGTGLTSLPWPQSSGGVPNVLLARANELVIGGDFDLTPQVPARALAFWNGTDFLGAGTDLALTGGSPTITAMVEYDGELVVAGRFDHAGTEQLGAIARWDGTGWRPLGTGLAGPDGAFVNALAVHRGYLVAAGSFTTAGGAPAANIARWNGYDWQALGPGIGGPNQPTVAALAVFGDALYAGGRFESAGGLASRGIARWDAE